MWIKLAIRRPIAVMMFFTALAVFGVLSYFQLKLQLLPDIFYPVITVRTKFLGAAPEDVERVVSVLLEDRLTTVTNLKSISSISRAGVSDILLQFSWQVDFDKALQEVREKLEQVNFRREVERPLVLRYDPGVEPPLRFAFFAKPGVDLSVSALKILIGNDIKPKLNTIAGVAAAIVKGGMDGEVQVKLQQEKMSLYHLSISAVVESLKSSNIEVAGGTFKTQDNEYLLRISNRFETLDDIRKVKIKQVGPAAILLQDVADVQLHPRDTSMIVRMNGKRAVGLEVFKESKANLVDVARMVIQTVDTLQKRSKGRWDYAVMSNQATYIENAIEMVKQTAFLGGVLAILIIFLFLRQWRPTLIIALSIPISIVITFSLMRLFGVTLNMMSLGGLALGIGMMVDSSIVVLESIVRHFKLGKTWKDAAFYGTQEVLSAITASTLTTIAVFVPIVFVKGFLAQIFTDFALTVVFSLLSSLVVATFVIPMATSRFFGRPHEELEESATHLSAGLAGKYTRMLTAVLNHKTGFVTGLLAILAYSIFLFTQLGAELLPEVYQGTLYVNGNWAVGTPIEKTERNVIDLEKQFNNWPMLESYSAIVGRDEDDLSNLTDGSNTAKFIFRLKPEKSNAIVEQEKQLFRLLKKTLETSRFTYTFKKPAFFRQDSQIQLQLFSENLLMLKQASHMVTEALTSNPSFLTAKSSLSSGFPEIIVKFDQFQLSRFGLSASHIAGELAQRIRGEFASNISIGGRAYDIILLQEKAGLASLEAIRQIPILVSTDRSLPLAAIADISVVEGPSEIRHIGRKRGVEIALQPSKSVDLRSAASLVQKEVAVILAPLLRQWQSLSYKISGANQERQEAEVELYATLALALFLVYVVMASQFESIVQPFLILFSVPLSVIGAVFFLWWGNFHINMMVFIGFIMLVGIVVNNAIVLFDYFNHLRHTQENIRSVVLLGAQVRLRPILMTSFSTILGLCPMVWGMGEGAELRAPMAITVIGGLLSSTLFTLFVIPLIYEKSFAGWTRAGK